MSLNYEDTNFKDYSNCKLCPRACSIDRYKDVGFCGESGTLSINSYMLHNGEEPPISFQNGSGTIFFTGCSLKCPYCQNMQISRAKKSSKREYSLSELITIIEELILRGADNINFVTPDHFLPHIIEAVKIIKKNSIDISFIYNCSGYQSLDSLKRAIEYIDIFLFDYKYASNEVSSLFGVNDYFDVVRQDLSFLIKERGNLVLDNGKAKSGVLVRHLIMPALIDNSISVVNNLYFDYGVDIFFSVMSQYSPKYLINPSDNFSIINRHITRDEYDQVIGLINDLGFKNCYIQDFIDFDDDFLPDFEKQNIFEGNRNSGY